MRNLTPICLAAALALLNASCVPNAPVHYYTIQPASPPVNQGKPDGLVLLVGEIGTPPNLQDGRIRYRTGLNEAGAYELHRWTQQPGLMVRNSLIRELRASGNFRRVLPVGSLTTGDYLLRGKLSQFDEVDGAAIETKITLQVELIDEKTHLNVWDHMMEHAEPVANKNVADVVASMDKNLRSVIGETVTELDKYLASRR
jgi:ABC-type uncharacterized transport system auxiliary subunit